MKSKIVRGKPLSLINSALRTYCREKCYAGEYDYFFFSNGVAVRKSGILSGPSPLKKTLSGLRKGFPVSLKCGISAAEIRVKNNIRVNFKAPGEGLVKSVKIGLPHKGCRSGMLGRAIKARGILRETVCKIRLPRIYEYDSSLRWLEEEYIRPDKKVSGGELAERFLSEYGSSLYEPFTRSHPLECVFNFFDVTVEEIGEVFYDSGDSLSDKDLKSLVPVSFIHGDLSPGNMIPTPEGDVYLVDWENFGAGPVAWDLKTLYNYKPEKVHKVLTEVSCPESKGGLSPARQMKVVLAVQLVKMRRSREDIINYSINHLGKPRARAVREFAESRKRMLASINFF